MAYLSRCRKGDLQYIAYELGEEYSDNDRIADLKNLILGSKNYDESFVQGMILNLDADRKEKMEAEAAERRLKLEAEKAKMEAEADERRLKMEAEKAKIEAEKAKMEAEKAKMEADEREALRKHELELKKLEMRVTNPQNNEASSKPKVDWQSQLRHFDARSDDIGLFLVHFERVMKRVNMEKSLWMACLVGVLPGEIVELILREPETLAEDYSHVKELLLKRYKLSAERFRQLFYSHKIKYGKTWKEFCYQLETYFNGWISGLKIETLEDMKNLIICDRIKSCAPTDVQDHYINEWCMIKSPSSLVDKIDEFIELNGLFKRHSVPISNQDQFGKRDLNSVKLRKSDPITCYNCSEVGHISRYCDKPKRPRFCTVCQLEGHGTRECPKLSKSPSVNASLTLRSEKNLGAKLVKVNGKSTEALIDTAADISMIKSTFAREINGDIENKNATIIRGIGGLTRSSGTCSADLHIDDLELKHKTFHVVDDNVYQGPNVLIGRDIIDSPDLLMIRQDGSSKLFLVNEFKGFCAFDNEEMDERITLKTLDAVTIPPRTIQLVKTVCNSDNENGIILTKNEDKAFLIKDRQATLPVTNYGSQKIHLKKNSVVLRGLLSTEYSPITTDDSANDSTSVLMNSKENILMSKNVVRNDIRCSDVKTGDIPQEQKQQICDLLNEFRLCIALKADELGCVKNTVMHITEKPGSAPVARAPYRASHSERQIMHDLVQEMKDQGIVRNSSSDYSSPVLLVKKKTGEYRMVIDYRKLNMQTVKDKFPLPCLDSLLDRLSGFSLFCILDACQGFNQIPLDDESSRKAAFTTPDGHFEPTRLFFGLANGPSVFQRCMSQALGDLLWNGVSCFVDDIFFGATNFEDMIKMLRDILEKLINAGIKLKLSKCEFAMTEVQYLGFTVSQDGIRPGPRKLAAIAEFPTPKSKHELRRFLGLASFFRRFIERYAAIVAPLTQLTKNEEPFAWNNEHDEIFDKIRNLLVSKPVLKLFDPRHETELHTDASSAGLAGMVLQRDEKNDLRLVYCVSRRTTAEEASYHSSRLELLAIVWSLNRLRPLLLGIHFTLVTDCSSILYLNSQRNIKPQVARWVEILSEFDYTVKHRSGSHMAHIDALSRAPIDTEEIKIGICNPDNEDLAPKPEVYYICTEEDKVALIQAQDEDIQKLINVTKNKKGQKEKEKNAETTDSSYEVIDGILYRVLESHGIKKKLFVMPKSMRKYLVLRYHDFSGHFGVDKVKMLIMQQFWFSRMTEYIKQHIRQCVTCAYTKVPGGKVQGKLNPIPPGKRPFEVVHMDFLGPFVRSSNRNTELLVFVDNLTKFIRLRPCSSSSTKCVLKYLEEFVNDFGSPDRVITDRGTCFTSASFEEFCRTHSIKHTLNCSQRPAANGQVERINRILIPMISSNVQKASQKDWDKELSEIQRCINWAPSKSTGKPPFEVLYGYIPNKFGELPKELFSDSTECSSLQSLRDDARNNILKAQDKMKGAFDKRHCVAQTYAVGDVVVVRRLPEATGNPTKTQVRYRGPFVVIKVLPSDVYRITDFRKKGQGRTRRPHTTTAHASQMKLFHIVSDDDEMEDDDSSDENEQ